jgi:hypothetical protein
VADTMIEIEGCNGDWFAVSGPGEGRENVWLAPEDEGTEFGNLYEPPVRTLWNAAAFQLGANYGGLREDKQEFTLAFHLVGTPDVAWRFVDSRFRRAWDFRKISRIWVTVDDSRRSLDVQLISRPIVKVGSDPNGFHEYSLVLLPLVAAYPRWMGLEVCDEWVARTDTTVSGTESGTVAVSNPTNNEIWLKWTVQGEAGIQWTIPDFSFGDDRFEHAAEDSDRLIVMPELIDGEHLRIDTDDMTRGGQVVSDLDTAVYLRMNSQQFLYPVPAYVGTDLAPIELPVRVTGAPIGAGIQVRCPRPWTRPWGLE